ncbi:hypothetical protein KVD72_00370 [Helicobacter pylori]|nr:hypothetical protein KVD72_00370 [Helicobacter pylori]
MKIKAIMLGLLVSGVFGLAKAESNILELDNTNYEALLDTYTFDLKSQDTIRDIYKAILRNQQSIKKSANYSTQRTMETARKIDEMGMKIDELEARIKVLEQQLKQAKK